MLLFVGFIFSLLSFSLANFKNRSKIFSAVDQDVTTFRFPWIPVRVTSSPKGLSSFILTYFSVYGVSPFKYSFNFSHKSVMAILFVIFCTVSNDLCEGFSPSYVFRSSNLHFSRATEGYWNAFFLLLFCSEVNIPLAMVQCMCARFLPVCSAAIELACLCKFFLTDDCTNFVGNIISFFRSSLAGSRQKRQSAAKSDLDSAVLLVRCLLLSLSLSPVLLG